MVSKELDLVQLDARYNSKITDVSSMKNLKVLDISSNCGIGQDGIKGLDLVKLDARFNDKIINVSFMKNLKAYHKN